MTELSEIRERDARTECAEAPCHQASADRRALLGIIDRMQREMADCRKGIVHWHEPERMVE